MRRRRRFYGRSNLRSDKLLLDIFPRRILGVDTPAIMMLGFAGLFILYSQWYERHGSKKLGLFQLLLLPPEQRGRWHKKHGGR